MKFKIESRFKAIPDQKRAIEKLAKGVLKGKPYQVLLGVTGSGKSLAPDEPILLFKQTEEGLKPKLIPIGQLIDNLLETSGSLNVGDAEILDANQIPDQFLIFSVDPSTGTQELQQITQFIRHKSPLEMYSIETTCGREIKVTEDHNFWVLRNGKLTLVKTKEIQPSDYLPVPLKLGFELDEPEGIMLNKWLERDTYFDINDIKPNKTLLEQLRKNLDYQKYYHVVNTHERINTSYLKFLSVPETQLQTLKIGRRIGSRTSLFLKLNKEFLYLIGLYVAEGHCERNYLLFSVHEEAMQFYFKNWLNHQKITYKKRTMNPGDFQINNSVLAEIFSIWCGNSAYMKRLPPWFWELSKNQLATILSSYFSGDGNVTNNEIATVTASKTLANNLVYALLRFGIKARIRKKMKRATNSNMKKKRYFEIIISGNVDLKVFSNEIGFVLDRKQRKLESILDKKNNTNVDIVPVDGLELRSLRESIDLSQKQLAVLTNCSRSHISLLEHNKRRPSRILFLKILNILESKPKNKLTLGRIQKLASLAKLFWTQVKKIKKIKSPSRFVYDVAVLKNETFLAGMGGIYVHNTFTMANVIERLQRPTLIISHNKTLAAQLYQELRDFFPKNAVSYFVSYYDFYQPEAYIPSTDTYIEKDSDINELIDKLRLAATTNLLTRKDTIVVASVSCIYNIGSPREYGHFVFEFSEGMRVDRKQIIDRLIDLQYERGDFGFHRSTFRVRGDTIDIYPSYQDEGVRIELGQDKIKNVSLINTVTGQTKLGWLKNFILYPAKHFITDPAKHQSSFDEIRTDLEKQVAKFKKEGKLLEAQRLAQRVNYDLEMIAEVGYVKGIENYSRYFDGRAPGEAPYSLLDYFTEPFGREWLVIVDESHMTFPQVRGMYNGDFARKKTLVDYGFRLPAALDNRPLRFEEFMRRIPNFIATSATPDEWEISMAKGKLTQQLLRPTGIPDPGVEIRPTKNQVADTINEIKKQVKKKQRTLVTTLTKRTAEDLSAYLSEQELKVHYLHSDVKTLDRGDILDDLRLGKYDVLVGINLLREGLDLPEVSLVAILDADKEGFLRSDVTLIQTMGRAARHVEGRVIMYADTITGSMQRALEEVERRRKYQIKMNKKYGITPKSIEKPIREKLIEKEEEPSVEKLFGKKESTFMKLPHIDLDGLTPMDKRRLVLRLRREMLLAAQDLNFELAAEIRDKARKIEASF